MEVGSGPVDTKIVKICAQMSEIWTLKTNQQQRLFSVGMKWGGGRWQQQQRALFRVAAMRIGSAMSWFGGAGRQHQRALFRVAAMGIGSAMRRAERGGPVDTKIVKIRAQMGEIWTLKTNQQQRLFSVGMKWGGGRWQQQQRALFRVAAMGIGSAMSWFGGAGRQHQRALFRVAAMEIGSAMRRAERGGPVDTKIVKIRAQMGEIWTLKDQPAIAALIQRRDEVGGW
jgi:hypothetical protein